jgi:hypothetical protein
MVEWHILGCGGVSSSASYRVNGTIGQSIVEPNQRHQRRLRRQQRLLVRREINKLFLPAILKN